LLLPLRAVASTAAPLVVVVSMAVALAVVASTVVGSVVEADSTAAAVAASTVVAADIVNPSAFALRDGWLIASRFLFGRIVYFGAARVEAISAIRWAARG
jgi:hypothetical protein